MPFEVLETDKFRADLEEAAFWLYSHNLEQSQDFADRKFLELETEINVLKTHLKKSPSIGQADDIPGIRRFPLYDGRYSVTWTINEKTKTVILLEFIDQKYPKELRQFSTED